MRFFRVRVFQIFDGAPALKLYLFGVVFVAAVLSVKVFINVCAPVLRQVSPLDSVIGTAHTAFGLRQ